MNTNEGITMDLDHAAYVDVAPRHYSSLRNGRDEKGADITLGALKIRLDERKTGELIDELVSSFPDEVEAALIDWGVTKAYLDQKVAEGVAA